MSPDEPASTTAERDRRRLLLAFNLSLAFVALLVVVFALQPRLPVPAMAVSPVLLDGAEWYRVFIGASIDRDDAERLLAQLRAAKVISGGNITSVPYALRLEGDVTTATVPSRITEYGPRASRRTRCCRPTEARRSTPARSNHRHRRRRWRLSSRQRSRT